MNETKVTAVEEAVLLIILLENWKIYHGWNFYICNEIEYHFCRIICFGCRFPNLIKFFESKNWSYTGGALYYYDDGELIDNGEEYTKKKIKIIKQFINKHLK